jgi:dihydrofolate reductase
VGRIIVSDNLTIDGVFEDPAGDEGFERGGWVGAIKDRPELLQLTLEDALGADAFLFGRRTYEWFSGRWPSRSGPLADRLNSMPKYVVSSTLEQPTWNNTVVVSGSLLDAVADLKRQLERDIVLTGSTRIAQTLLEHDLVDELRLKVFPVVLGAGRPLFGGTSAMKRMRLLEARSLDGDTAYLVYQRRD